MGSLGLRLLWRWLLSSVPSHHILSHPRCLQSLRREVTGPLHQSHPAAPVGTMAGGRDAPGCQGFGMRQLAKGHSGHVAPITASPARVSPSRWPDCGSRVTVQTPLGDAAAGPSIVQCFLPPARRLRGRQHREEDKQPLIWAPQTLPFHLCPDGTGHGHAALALPDRGRAAHHTSGSIPRGGQAGSWGPWLGWPPVQGRDASGGDAGQRCQAGTICPWGRQQRAPALCQNQIRGLSWTAGVIR